jgi:hypothetical protein
MSKFWKVTGAATLVVALGLMAIGAVAWAQDSDDGDGWPFDFGERLHEAMATALGISVDEYDTAVQSAREQVLGQAVEEGWLTEEQAERMRERADAVVGPGLYKSHGGPRGAMGPGRGRFAGGPKKSLLAVTAEQLGMTLQELGDELQNGKSVAAVAGERGVDVQTITEAYIGQHTEQLNEAVEDGRITQERADWMLEQMEERLPDMLNNTWEDCAPGGHPGMRPGGFRNMPGQVEGTSS